MRTFVVTAIAWLTIGSVALGQVSHSPPLASGEGQMFYIQTAESFSVLCDYGRTLTAAAAAITTKIGGVGLSPATGIFVTSTALSSGSGDIECSCANCCVIALVNPSSCPVETKCQHGNSYQITLPATPSGGGTMRCDIRADVWDVRFRPR